ncbi:pentapeptide repeat [Trichodesmium erythraeum IMS101]|uniref:Pentapeptide repeat n=1 Tax=Trichodesmium erythraeum (strain IMS101) TaxID=203124 RepID=Q10YL7_TRIEI|nr:pentapeptide repeat-containing protein [Trichodesmium erythraeum GBRTRLIN201]MCH2050670.1 pentapeptide repeat-containing protein [Trichodesmium sp. ALOHA_ZT_67]
MNQLFPLNFSGQDLRHRDFQGQDLTGANFSGSDLRGCNFQDAILYGTNFRGARIGQSRSKVWTLIFCCAGAAIAVTLTSAFASFIAGEMPGVTALIGTGAVAIAITNTKNEIIAAILAGVVATIGSSGIVYFLSGSKVKGLFLFLGSGVILGLGLILFFQVVFDLEKLSKTSFENADLTNAIFDE